jgi:ribosomal protein S18 acetylase RimI-like enzyme
VSAAYTIRIADPGDAADIAEAHRDSIRSIGPRFYPDEVVSEWFANVSPARYVRAMERGEVFFIATGTIGDKPAVLGFSTHRVDGDVHGTAVYVRGAAARRGVGSALFRLAEAHARDAGATSIQIDASLAGLDFYRSHGFVETGRGDHELQSGARMACVFMRKDLG